MNIIFLAKKLESASYLFYKDSFSKLKNIDKSINMEFKTFDENFSYKDYQFAFFMGGAIDSLDAKKENPNIKCVVVDSRAGHYDDLKDIDLLISNGLENYLYNYSNNYLNLRYETYPEISLLEKKQPINSKLVLGYHGNKIHLDSMFPRITNAIEKLNNEVPLELWAMYNIAGLGISKKIITNKIGFSVKHIQYSHENYINYMSKVDIGLVPQLMPYNDNIISRIISLRSINKYNQHKDDYTLRFKETTNLGRQFIFFQLKVPVISDMTPSALSFIKNEENGFIAYSSENWYNYLRMLSKDTILRETIAFKAYNDWSKEFSHDNLNLKLIKILKKLI